MSYEKTKSLLEEKYPDCFVKLGETPKPLKKGIKDDILALMSEYPDILSKRSIRKYMSSYVNRPSYLKCIKTGVKRIDLAGNEVGEVTESEYDYTKTQQEESIKKFQQKKKDVATKKEPSKDDAKKVAKFANQLQAELEKIIAQDETESKRKVLSLKKKVG